MTPRKYNECPECLSKCHWRTGQGFDHEMICYKCYNTFDPDEEWAKQEEERLYYNTHED